MSKINTAIALPPAFPLVGLGLGGTAALLIWQGLTVGGMRKPSGVKYPNMYASDADALADKKKMVFNCAQRAHQNTLENAGYILVLTLFVAVFYPQVATGLNLLWCLARVFYTLGYSTGDPKQRYAGLAPLHYIGVAGLIGMSFYISAAAALKLYL